MGVRVMGLGAAFMLQILLARTMNLEAFGTYVYVFAWINFLVLFTKLGLDAAALRFAGSYGSAGSWSELRGYCMFSVSLVVLIGTAVSAVLAIVVVMVVASANRPVWLIGLVIVPFTGVGQVCGGIIQGLRHVVSAQAPQQVLRPLVAAALAAGIYAVSAAEISAAQAMLCQLFAAIVMVMVLLARAVEIVPAACRTVRSVVGPWREWMKVGWPLLLVGGFNIIMSHAGIAMLGSLGTAADAGLYAVATRIASLLAFVNAAVNGIAAPLIASYHEQGRLSELRATLSYATLGIFAISALLCVVLVLFSGFFLGLFGAEFVAAENVMHILLGASLINAAVGSVGYLLIMTGRQQVAMIIQGGVAVLNVVGNALLIPSFGSIGAAYSTAAAIIISNVAMYVYCRRVTGLDPSILALLRRSP